MSGIQPHQNMALFVRRWD